jgi:hypothetical protein
MTRFTRIAIAALLSASSFAISEAPAGDAISPDTRIALPQEVQSFLAVAQVPSRADCLNSCQNAHTSCRSTATTDNAKSACEKAQGSCSNACPKNKD